jgi:hypothetical protein
LGITAQWTGGYRSGSLGQGRGGGQACQQKISMAEFSDSQDHEMLQRKKAPREERGTFLMRIY